jgi:hypothetical protein
VLLESIILLGIKTARGSVPNPAGRVAAWAV